MLTHTCKIKKSTSSVLVSVNFFNFCNILSKCFICVLFVFKVERYYNVKFV